MKSEIPTAPFFTETMITNYIVGLGGRDIPKEVVVQMYDELEKTVNGNSSGEMRFLGMRW